jgi:hypothetical protein
MSMDAHVLAVGVVDRDGIYGTSGVAVTWEQLETDPPGTAKTLKAIFDRTDPTFRRIDLPAKTLVLAAEAAGVGKQLTDEQRAATTICVETEVGSITTDVDFQESLKQEVVQAGIFPYSLTSTCLGELALRYGLRGATVSVSVMPDAPGEGLRESLRILAADEAPFVVTGYVDALRDPADGREPGACALLALLGREEAGIGRLQWPARDDRDPFSALRRLCR